MTIYSEITPSGVLVRINRVEKTQEYVATAKGPRYDAKPLVLARGRWEAVTDRAFAYVARAHEFLLYGEVRRHDRTNDIDAPERDKLDGGSGRGQIRRLAQQLAEVL